MLKRWLSYLLPCVAIPVIVVLGAMLFQEKAYAWVTLCVTVFACAAFFLAYEKGHAGAKQMILIAVMIALSVVGRLLFTPLPGFKPVTALVILTALYFGPQAGFMTGALTALISNFYFGQGPWTPVQMLVWGLIGLLAGLLRRPLRNNRWALLAYGAFAGVLFSWLMDVWTVLWWDNGFNLARFFTAIASASGFTAVYAVSNVIFLFLFTKPIGRILERMQTKYGL